MTTKQPEALIPDEKTVMAQAQVYASTWAIVGSRFDAGDGLELAEQEKTILADMVRRLGARITELESQLAQRFDAADMATASAQGFRDGVASAASWISVDARLPEPNTPVLLDIGKMFPLRALWAGKHTVRVATDVDDCGEYDEETDEYYCPEGWYEWNEHEEVHWAVSETPRAWRELPPPLPAAPGPADGESNG